MMGEDFAHMHPRDVRQCFRDGLVDTCTGKALGYVQAGLVILPKEFAYDFLLFSYRNPKPCSVLEITDPGNPEPVYVAPGADLRVDLPLYRVFVDGELVDEPSTVSDHWRDDFVCFLMAGSLTWEHQLMREEIPIRHLEMGRAHPIYVSNIECRPAGVFRGPMLVSLMPIPGDKVVRAIQVSSRFPSAHGSPVHVGAAQRLGITDVVKPDYGDPPNIQEGDELIFWATSATPTVIAQATKLPMMIVHAPNHVFITDLPDHVLAVI